MSLELKEKIAQAITSFKNGSLFDNSIKLFSALGYKTGRQSRLKENNYGGFMEDFPSAKNRMNPKKTLQDDWISIDLVFQLTQAEMSNQTSLFDSGKVDDAIIEAYLFFALELSGKEYSRTQLSEITRELNRVFSMPVMVIFKYDNRLTISVIKRRLHKLDSSKDVLEKVTQIKDIKIDLPHRAHIEILFDLSFDELWRKYNFSNFVELHNAWQKTLDTKELNKRFYGELFNWYLWAIRSVNFPNDVNDDMDDRIYNSESVIRLLTRLIFVWFIKEKNLVPNSLFELNTLKNILKDFNSQSMYSSVYYRAILQNLFFATLNTPMDGDITEENKDEKRQFLSVINKYPSDQYLDQTKYRYKDYFTLPDKVLELFSTIPFLNGGLFECLDFKEDNIEIRYDGFSIKPKNQAFVPDKLFFSEEFLLDLNPDYGTKGKSYKVKGLIKILDNYKFTITENTPLEEEIALDPELLGKVFENLLASYNPETQTTARKQTGSFYTPREIVNYMVDESLIAYFKQKLDALEETETRLRDLFAHTEDLPKFSETETDLLIYAISQAKILDPACGSGAFPMGVLHRLVDLLKKLDHDNERWNNLQIKRAIDETAEVFVSGSLNEEREIRLTEINKAFDLSMNYPDYARKLFLIENCIYGVDIQQIAIQISKLRFFISLIVDQKVNDAKTNRNILSMPNLETKFVAANTLIGLDKPQQKTLMAGEVERLEKELSSIRHKIFFTRKYSEKKALKKTEKAKREELQTALTQTGYTKNTATQMAGWNPFDPMQSAKFFDSETMFGFKNGFDVVIGNPPYINISNLKPDEYRLLLRNKFRSAKNKSDTYAFFLEKGFQLLNSKGNLTFIIPQTWKATDSFSKLRDIIFRETSLAKIVDLDFGTFDAIVKPMVVVISNEYGKHRSIEVYNDSFEKISEIKINEVLQDPALIINTSSNENQKKLFKIIESQTIKLESIIQFSRGIKTSDDNRFVLHESINEDCRKVFRGKNIKGYQMNWDGEYIWYRPDLMKEKVGSVTYTKSFFEVPEKIVTQRVNSSMQLLCAYDNGQNYFLDTTIVSRYDTWDKITSLKFLCAVLNSKLINFWYCNKYLMPTIGIYEIHAIPIKITTYQDTFSSIASFAIFLKSKFQSQNYFPFFERLIDAMVYELYLPEPIKAASCDVLKYLDNLPELTEGEDEKNLRTIEKVYKELSHPNHPISSAMMRLLNIEEIEIIEGRK